MRALSQLFSRRLCRSRSLFFASSTSSPCETLITSSLKSSSSSYSSRSSHSSASRSFSDLISSPRRDRNSVIGSPWQAIPTRGLKVNGIDLRVGNVIEKKDRIYKVLKVEHSHEGRGKATIKVELRDVDSGNKVNQRIGTEETVEKVFVEAKSCIYMCTDRDGKVLLMDPDTLDELEVREDMFGKKAKYLQDDMKVKVEVYNGIPLSLTIPKHVTCTVKEAPSPVKGLGVTPREKTAVLENGVSVKVPAHVVAGDKIVVDTDDDSYLERAKA